MVYDFRSRFVHGDLDFAGLCMIGDARDTVARFDDELRDATAVAVALLAGTLQEVIRLCWNIRPPIWIRPRWGGSVHHRGRVHPNLLGWSEAARLTGRRAGTVVPAHIDQGEAGERLGKLKKHLLATHVLNRGGRGVRSPADGLTRGPGE